MWYNYVKIVFRSLRKFKGYVSINIFGLVIGLVCCLLIIQYLWDEWKVDKYYYYGGEIYCVVMEFIIGNIVD